MSWGEIQGRDGLSATEFLESELVKKGFPNGQFTVWLRNVGRKIATNRSFAVGFRLKNESFGRGNKSSHGNGLYGLARFPNGETYVLLVQFYLRTIRRELSELGLSPTGQRLGDKFL